MCFNWIVICRFSIIMDRLWIVVDGLNWILDWIVYYIVTWIVYLIFIWIINSNESWFGLERGLEWVVEWVLDRIGFDLIVYRMDRGLVWIIDWIGQWIKIYDGVWIKSDFNLHQIMDGNVDSNMDSNLNCRLNCELYIVYCGLECIMNWSAVDFLYFFFRKLPSWI